MGVGEQVELCVLGHVLHLQPRYMTCRYRPPLFTSLYLSAEDKGGNPRIDLLLVDGESTLESTRILIWQYI